jgi:hypothetical protein
VTDEPSEQRHRGPENYQQNLANRLFPGPSRRMTNRAAEHIEGLLNPLENDAVAKAWRDRRNGTGATSDDIAQVHDSLEEQNELLRAILASSVDTQTDARATAQNSRTFAWAGTAIALLTLIATIISIVAAVGAA